MRRPRNKPPRTTVIVLGLLLISFLCCFIQLATKPTLLTLEATEMIENFTYYNSFSNHIPYNNWTREWLEIGTNGEQARILLVHVGKTGGVALSKGIPADLVRKKNSLPCAMQAWLLLDKLRKLLTRTHNKNHTRVTSPHASSTPVIPSGSNLSTTKEAIHMMTLDEAWAKCYRPNRKAPALGRHIFSHKHMYSTLFKRRELTWVLNHVNTFLITIRSPVARIVSAFNFHREATIQKHMNPKSQDNQTTTNENKTSNVPLKKDMGKRLLLECFESIDHLAEGLARSLSSSSSSSPSSSSSSSSSGVSLSSFGDGDCIEIGRKVLQGKGPIGQNLQHFHHNYQFYESETIAKRPSVPVVVVRTEQLWQDAKRLDIALGGNGRFKENNEYRATHGSEKFSTKTRSTFLTGMSTKDVIQRQALCCQIYLDIASYQRIVLRALNLNHTEKVDTLQLALKECGVVSYTKDPVLEPFDWDIWHKQFCAE